MINLYYGIINHHTIDEITDLSVKKRLLQIKNKQQQKVSIHAYYYLLHYLKKIDGKVELSFDTYNKPYVKNNKNIFISLSHSKNHFIFAISNQSIGVDLEYISDFSFLEQTHLYNRIVSLKEQSDFACNTNDLIKIWTIKESYLKLLGVGLTKDLQQVQIFKDKVGLSSLNDAYYTSFKFLNFYIAFSYYNKENYQFIDIQQEETI